MSLDLGAQAANACIKGGYLRNWALERPVERLVAYLRTKGLTGVTKTVYEVWSRFKKMLWNCPNHDIPRHIQVHTFYHRLTNGDKDKLDHLNGDSFLSGTTTECHNLLNNLAANHYEKNVESIQFVSNARKSQNNPYSNTYSPRWRQHPNFSWNNNQGQGSALRFQQVQQSMQEKKPSLEKTLMQFMASTAANFKIMETQIGQLANAINSRPQRGTLRSRQGSSKKKDKEVISEQNEKEVEASLEVSKPTSLQPPFPQKLQKQKLEKQFQNFFKVFKKFHINIPFAEALEQMPSYIFCQTKKKHLVDYETVALTEECSAIIQNKLPPKLKDPGSFTIYCTIGKHFSGRALCDLGASINLMPYSIYYTLGLGEAKPTSITLQLADRSLTYPKGVIEDILVKVEKFMFPADFVVLDMKANTIKFSNESDECLSISIIDNLAGKESIAERLLDPFERALLDLIDEKNEEDLEVVKTLDASKFFKLRGIESLERTVPSKVLKPLIEEPPTLELKPLPNHLRYAHLEKLLRVLRDHKSAIGWTIADIKGISPSFCMHKILLKDDQKSSVERIIYPISDSSWVSPVQCVPNKGAIIVVPNMHKELIPTRTVTGWRVCMDYRKLNKATRKDHFPLPFIDQMLDRLAGKEFYCFLNGYSGHNQIAIAPEDQEKTTFTCRYVTFQRCMMAIFTDVVENFLEVFMDDFSVYRNSFDECLNNLSSVLKRYGDTNLVFNWEKCHFMVQEGIVLGHKISNRGIEVNKAKLKTIEKLPPSTLVKGVRSFLGYARFYRRFIKDFSKISKPLYNLLEKDIPFKFDDACLHVFNDLKGRLISAPIITVPDWAFPFELMDKIFCSIYYNSKIFNDAQMNYTTTEKELLAVVFAFDKFRSYLVGTKVIVYTDHSAIRYLIEKKDAKPRLEYPAKTDEPNLINDNFLDEQLLAIVASNVPWYTDIVNYLTCGIVPFDLCTQQKKKFLFDTRRYFWDEPFLFKQCSNHILRLFGKACHLPVELEHNAYWDIRKLNFDMQAAGEKRLLQLNELDEFQLQAYENAKI
ncbi:DNA-directed DNA polymerase [Handroanthus impetiginosus]|uniref:RNA-directed DNA polymerase n=1 Tax=Handroanthus impetiginosus TaxID=429701 RepID=A0A2G9G306_9LAMI|nr:DNA-directed DNA polymerase [Handroanthus impetiginosus]